MPVETAEGCLIVDDLRKIHLVTDATRRAILERLVNGAMTSRALAKELGISQQLAYHHLQKLIHASLVEVKEIDRRGNKEVYFYQAVAKAFKFEVPEIRSGMPLTPFEPRHALHVEHVEAVVGGNGNGHALGNGNGHPLGLPVEVRTHL
jgi:DNA-binding transcriptional ArsR family regulator